jgi:hypothetical protein
MSIRGQGTLLTAHFEERNNEIASIRTNIGVPSIHFDQYDEGPWQIQPEDETEKHEHRVDLIVESQAKAK